MPNLALCKAIENVADANEARVLAIIDHLAPILSNWRRGADLAAEVAALDKELATLRDEFNMARRQEKAVAEQHEEEVAAARKWMIVGVIAAAVAVVCWFAIGFLLALVPALLSGVMLFMANGKRSAASDLESQKLDMEKRVADIDTQMKQAAGRRAAIEAETQERRAGFPELKLADVRFGLSSVAIVGHNVLLDASGSHERTKLKTVDVSALANGLTDISGELEKLRTIPTLLSPGDGPPADDPVYQLFGEEGRLHDMVSDFTVNIGKLKDVELALPLIPRDSILLRRLQAGEMSLAGDQPVIAVLEQGETPQSLEAFTAQVNRTREQGVAVLQDLQNVFVGLESACRAYGTARTTSVNVIHQNLLEVLNRATWCSRRFYCPRTILSPGYLQDLLGIEIDRAYLLSLDDIWERLRSDAEIAKRIDSKPELEQQLSDAYASVQEFLQGISFGEDGQPTYDTALPRHMRNQFEESTKRLGNVLRRIMTGSAHPILNFSRNAQLYYDPDADQWSSDVSPYTYSTPDALRYGAVIKAHSDLMMPLWEHLWTEKADFRKSELFRTNETMIRMTEKESEKLIEIANQFRADMRTVRENTHLIEADLKSKFDEITNFRDGMDRLGLLSERVKSNISDEKLATVILGVSSMTMADRYETVLATLPQSQAESRGVVQDPIDIVREPNALIRLETSSDRRLLAS